jgi:hypothetical protein
MHNNNAADVWVYDQQDWPDLGWFEPDHNWRIGQCGTPGNDDEYFVFARGLGEQFMTVYPDDHTVHAVHLPSRIVAIANLQRQQGWSDPAWFTSALESWLAAQASHYPDTGALPMRMPQNATRTPRRLRCELEALGAAGHVMSRSPAPMDGIPADLGLVRDVQHWACTCGLMLLAGARADGMFAVVCGVSGAYGLEADPEAINADLEARRGGPCPAAHARESFHASAGYQRFAECFND